MLFIVAALLLLISVFHSLVGERVILQRIKEADNLPKLWNSRQATFRTIQATWHLVTALWLGLAAQLVVMALRPDWAYQSLLIIFGLLFAVLTIVPLVWESGKHKSWIIFGSIAGLLLAKAYLG